MESPYYKTREEWLNAAAAALWDYFEARTGLVRVPAVFSVGFPRMRGRSARLVVGQCWPPRATVNGVAPVYVSPVIDAPVDVLETLLHEMLHAALLTRGINCNHAGEFIKLARACGFIKPWRVTPSGPELALALLELGAELGPYPHGRQYEPERRRKAKKLPGPEGGGDEQPETETIEEEDGEPDEPRPGSRLRRWVCPCGKIARVASDNFLARCLECDEIFEKKTT